MKILQRRNINEITVRSVIIREARSQDYRRTMWMNKCLNKIVYIYLRVYMKITNDLLGFN